MKAHPLATMFPRMTHEDSSRLAEDIRTRGFDKRFPIITYQGAILDGLNRWECIRRLRLSIADGMIELDDGVSIDPVFVEYDGDDPLGFVISANLARRHLNASQRSSIAAEIANMRHGGDRASGKVAGCSQADAARLLNVSERSVRDAAKVKAADPKLHEEIKAGRVSVAAAAKRVRGDDRRPKVRNDEAAALEPVVAGLRDRVADLEKQLAAATAPRPIATLPTKKAEALARIGLYQPVLCRLVSLLRHDELWVSPGGARTAIIRETVNIAEALIEQGQRGAR